MAHKYLNYKGKYISSGKLLEHFMGPESGIAYRLSENGIFALDVQDFCSASQITLHFPTCAQHFRWETGPASVEFAYVNWVASPTSAPTLGHGTVKSQTPHYHSIESG